MNPWLCGLVLGWCVARPDAQAMPTPQIDAGLVAGVRGATGALLRHDFDFLRHRCDDAVAGCSPSGDPALAGAVASMPVAAAFPPHVLTDDGAGKRESWMGAEHGCGSGTCSDPTEAGTEPDAFEAAIALTTEDRDASAGNAPPAAPVIAAAPGLGAVSAIRAMPVVGATPAAGVAPEPGSGREALAMPGTGAASGDNVRYSRQWQSVVALSVPAFVALLVLGAAGFALWSRRRF